MGLLARSSLILQISSDISINYCDQAQQREKGIKTKMRVKVAAKILVIAWTLLKKGEKFRPGYLLRQP